MANETIEILKLQVEGAQTVADLRENVKQLKTALQEAEKEADSPEGWENYQKTLELLKQNQAALKDAMYATKGTFDDVKKAAVGATTSYNGLVNKMAELKREFRATNDEARRNELGKQINSINQQLKEMDAMQGNFQRNVGNYRSVLSGLGDGLDAFRKGLGAATGGINGMKDATEALAKSPMVATFSIIVSLVMKLADELKDNETAMAGIKKGLDALKPVMDFFSGIIENIAEYLADIISKVAEFVTNNGLFNKIISGVMGVGNAILKFVVAPFKGVIAAIKVFKDQGIKGIGDAARAFGNEMKSGVAFKENFSAGQVAADTMLSGVKSRKKEAKDAGKELGKEAGKSFAEGMYDEALRGLKVGEKWDEAIREWKENLDDSLEEANEDLQGEIDNMFQGEVDALKKALEEEDELRKQDLEKAKSAAEAKKALLEGVASATSDILGAIADLYETDEENSEENAKKIKNLRIASATIDTISGAIGAFMQAAKNYPAPYGAIIGGIQAAAITAAGMAQIAQIKSTQVSANAGDSSAPVVSAQVSAPMPTMETVQPVRNVTSASEELRLNRMASDQKVYLVTSELEMHQQGQKVRIAEGSF